MENQFDMRMQDTGFSPLMTDVNLRSRFLVRTYANLLGAVLAFIALETVLFSLFFNQIIGLLGSPQAVCIAILAVGLTGPFIGSMIINHSKTISGHYVALGFYVLMYVVMFTPILAVAYGVFGTGLIVQAGLVTGVIFVLLSLTVFLTKKDFSFLRSFLVFASLAAVGFIVVSLIFGFNLGLGFTYAMIALASLYILYDTSNVMLHCDESMYVVAAIELFASVMLLFFYILRLFMSRSE